ncbi:hypothetical protein [Lampropedia aestuarii]|uniref:hypothetical protein n=1 Tax=Lampropedia aestuarii TaxID=2562762 RepID=UPI002468AE0D|nr:hypothetical protein [Lampropedia aestuarii]MDH5857295.1 hypothetical protein [Lampropedia aestuarii]
MPMPHLHHSFSSAALQHAQRPARWLALGLCVTLAACTPYAGVSVPVGPVSVGVGASSGGVSMGVGTGVGPVGVGVGVNQRGQVTGSAGVGASTSLGDSNARIGAGVGSSTTLYDPQNKQAPANAPAAVVQPGTVPAAPANTAPAPAATQGNTLWRDAQGNAVPACKVRGQC